MSAPRRGARSRSPPRPGSPCCPPQAAHSARAGAAPIAPGRHRSPQALCSVEPRYSRIAPLPRPAARQPIPLWDRGGPASTAPGPAARTAPAPGPPRKNARGLAGAQRSPPMGRREGGRAARWTARLRARGACREMQSWRRRDDRGRPTGERASWRGHQRRPAGGIYQQIMIMEVIVVMCKHSALNTHSATC